MVARFRALAVGLCVLSAASSSTRAAAETCPVSLFQVGPPSYSTLAARETTVVIDGATLSGSYDLRKGVSTVAMTPCALLETQVRSVDRYHVIDIAPGSSVDLVVGLEVGGFVYTPGCGGSGCEGWFRASLRAGADSVVREVSVGLSGRADLVETLWVPLHVSLGEEFEIETSLDVRARPGANHGGSGYAEMIFDGLPTSASIVS